jgi:hypothetical protein
MENGLPRALYSTERCQVMGFQKKHLDGFGNLTQKLSTPDGANMIGDSFDVPTMAHVLAPLKGLQVRSRIVQSYVARFLNATRACYTQFHVFRVYVLHVV